MSEENVELFRRFLAAFNRGDLEGAIALADPPPEFEFVASGLLLPDLAAVQRGPEGLRRTAELFWAEFDDVYVELVELIDAGDQVFISVIFRGVEGSAAPRRTGIFGAYGRCGTAAWFAGRDSRTVPQPLKPPGCRSSALDEKRH
jgi:ketosteroid isomerase-like protein